MGNICARCGRPLEPGKHVGALCLDCFLETTRLLCVESMLEFEYCKYCGSIRLGHKWVEGGDLEEATRRFLEWYVNEHVRPCTSLVKEYRLIDMYAETVPSWRTIYRLEFEFILEGIDEPVTQLYRVTIYARPTICPLCKDARGGDYNVLVQLRGVEPRRLAEKLSALFNSNSHLVESIIDIVELRNGADIFLSDRGSASRIIRELRKHFSVRVVTTGEDVGISSRGKLRRRLVYSVRLRERRR